MPPKPRRSRPDKSQPRRRSKFLGGISEVEVYERNPFIEAGIHYLVLKKIVAAEGDNFNYVVYEFEVIASDVHAIGSTVAMMCTDKHYKEIMLRKVRATNLALANSFLGESPEVIGTYSAEDMEENFASAIVGLYEDCDEDYLSSELGYASDEDAPPPGELLSGAFVKCEAYDKPKKSKPDETIVECNFTPIPMANVDRYARGE